MEEGTLQAREAQIAAHNEHGHLRHTPRIQHRHA